MMKLYRKLLLCLVFCLSLSLFITSCGDSSDKDKDTDEKTYRVMVSLDEGAKVEGENPIEVKAGESATFKVVLEKGYAFKSCSAGTYDQKTSTLTVPDVNKNTNVDFLTEKGEFDTDVKLKYIFVGEDADTTDVKSGVTVSSGTRITVEAKDLSMVFQGWSYGAPLKAGGTLLTKERLFSFNISKEYAKGDIVRIFSNYIDATNMTYDLNGGDLDTNNNMVKSNVYYTAEINGTQVKLTYTPKYLDFAECASSFWDSGVFTRKGYILQEYNTKADGSGESYSIGSKVPLIINDESTVLYCIWAKDTDQGSFVYDTVTFGYPKKVDAKKAPHWVTGESIRITKYTGNEKTVVIPEMIGDKYVTSIATDAFVGKDIETLVMGRRILKVDDGSFKNCTSLNTIYYPDGLFIMNNEALDEASYKNFKHLYVNATLAPRFMGGADGGLAVKLSRLLASEDQNRIIVIAGSSVLQGVSTEYMEALLEGDYRVINFGTTRTTHGTLYLEAMQHLAHEGDTIIYAPENSAYMMGERELYWKTLRDLEGMNNIYRYVDISNYTNIFGAFTDYNRNYRYTRNPRAYEEICNLKDINKYGDYLNPRRETYVDDSRYIDSYYITMNNRMKSRFDGNWNDPSDQEANKNWKDPDNKTWCSIDDAYYKDNMNRVIKCAQSSGAKVYFGFCPVDGNALVEEANNTQWLKNYDKFIDDTYAFDGRIGSCMNYIYDHKYFFDCAFHVNDYGRTYRTYQLYIDLCDKIGITEKTGFLDYGTEFEGCIFEDCLDGKPLTPWSPKA